MNKKLYWVVGIVVIILLAMYAFNYNKEESTQTSQSLSMPMNHQMHMAIISEEQFISEMIPHHQEAVDTAKIILANSNNQELKALAQNIVNAQTQEIAQLKSWRTEFYPNSAYQAAYTPMMPNLEKLKGNDLDNAFIQGMIMHHMMAIMMAQQVLSLNPHQEVADFANQVIKVQSAEIKQMQEMLSK